MKGDLTLKILEFIERVGITSSELMGIYFADNVTSYRRARGFITKEEWQAQRLERIARAEKHRLDDLLYRLKKDGILIKDKESKWHLTKEGIKERLRLRKVQKKSLPTVSYQVNESTEWKIILFDIPEREKRKRQWLRETLRRLGFKMLQKSVWIGKIGLPKAFIDHLNELGLLPYVEILAITKKGSLRHL